MTEIYRGYEISETRNEWGFFEAYNQNNCDASVLYAKTYDALIETIDLKLD